LESVFILIPFPFPRLRPWTGPVCCRIVEPGLSPARSRGTVSGMVGKATS